MPGPRTTAVKRIGLYGRILPHEHGRIWQTAEHFNVASFDGDILERHLPALVPKRLIAMSRDAWFVNECDGPCGPHGTGRVIKRIERVFTDRNASTTKLAGPESEIVFAQVLGDKLYWATFGPYGNTGELRRVPTTGGKTETLWTGAGVSSVLLTGNTAYVADDKTVTAVPLDGAKPLVLAKDLRQAQGLAVDATHVYITDRGDPHWQSKPSGSVLRVPLRGGAVEKLAGPAKWPSVVAVDDERIYFMGDDSGEVWALAKKAGTASVLIPTPEGDWPCRSTKWLHVNKHGLYYLRMSRGWDSRTGKPINWGTQWAIGRAFLDDPVRRFREYLAKKAAGSATAKPDLDTP